MTTVVAVYDSDTSTVWMGADRQAVSGWERTDSDFVKIFQTSPLCLCAITGKSLLKQVLEFGEIDWAALDKTSTKNLKRYLVMGWLPEVRAALKAENMNPRDIEGQIMLVTRGHIVVTDSNLSIRVYNAYSKKADFAIGSGSSYALGSLYSTTGQHPRWRIETALMAASTYDIGTGHATFDIQPELRSEKSIAEDIVEPEKVLSNVDV